MIVSYLYQKVKMEYDGIEMEQRWKGPLKYKHTFHCSKKRIRPAEANKLRPSFSIDGQDNKNFHFTNKKR